jgi:hypothetical protein
MNPGARRLFAAKHGSVTLESSPVKSAQKSQMNSRAQATTIQHEKNLISRNINNRPQTSKFGRNCVNNNFETMNLSLSKLGSLSVRDSVSPDVKSTKASQKTASYNTTLNLDKIKSNLVVTRNRSLA